ncbi:MAG: alpha/beta fold hydrolase [Lutimaribacter sp.]
MVWGVGAGRLQAAGFDLEYQCFGPPPGQAPTIVLLHEGLGAVALWRDFPQALADVAGGGVFAYSRAGYGRSGPRALPWPLDYMTREATHVLPDVLQAIGFQNGILMGHSDGATIAAIYAGSVGDFRVRGLVLMAPHFFTEPMGLAAIAKARTAYEQGDLRAKLAKYHDTPDIAFRGWNDSWLAEGFAKWNVADVIDYLRIPTLAIQGNADEYGSLAQIEALETRSYAPVDVEILPQCGHAPHLDAPQAVLAAVGEFCARLARIEAAQPETA